VLLISNNDVKKLLDMPSTLDALDSAFAELAKGDATGMGRIDLYVPSQIQSAPYYRWAVMTGGSRKDGYVCARMLSDMVSWPREHGAIRENKFARAPGTYCGLLFLFSVRDATPVAMFNDGYLQHMRVGGGAGLGVKYLSREDSQVVGMIGSGGMARTYLDAFCCVRKITRVQVFSPNEENLRAYARHVEERHGIEVTLASSARAAAKGADIISICTSSNQPVFMNEWLESGQHITNLTSADVEPSLSSSVDIAFRAGEATPRLEQISGDRFYARAGFLAYVAGSADERALVPKLELPQNLLHLPFLAELISGARKGRTESRQTSFFLNVGAIGAQFESVAAKVYERARARNLGQEIPTDWFLQDERD
jgi:alanine dehydrogenase